MGRDRFSVKRKNSDGTETLVGKGCYYTITNSCHNASFAPPPEENPELQRHTSELNKVLAAAAENPPGQDFNLELAIVSVPQSDGRDLLQLDWIDPRLELITHRDEAAKFDRREGEEKMHH